MEIRKITAQERADILRGMDYAYSEWSEREIEASQLNTINPDDAWAVFVDGKIASGLINHNFKQSVRGVVKGMGGIGGVWTYPEYRNRGYVRELLLAAFIEMKQRNAAVSMLIPFKESFYSAFGYVTANSNLDVKASLHSLIHAFEPKADPEWQFERVPASQIKNEFFEFMFAVASKQYHGINLPVNMTDEKWKLRTQKELCVFVNHNDQLVALAIYSIDASGFKPKSDRAIYVYQMFWNALKARDKLFSFFASHRDQVGYIMMDLPFGTNFFQWFRNITEPYEPLMMNSSSRRIPYMVRVMDVERAIADLPAPVKGKVTLEISDSHCNWNNGIFTLEEQDGKLTVISEQTQPDIQLTIQGISALVYGTLPFEEIEYRQWLNVLNPDARETLEKWFSVLPIYNTFRF